MLSKLVTIIIPCKNEENYIGNILDDIANQDDILGTKVIVADADSFDRTVQIVMEKADKYKHIDIVITNGGTVSEGRNNGSLFAETPFLCFIDADVRLFTSNTLVDTVAKGAQGYKLVTCKLKSYSKSYISKLAFWVYNYIHKLLSLKYPFAIGAYFFVCREKFNQFGKFSTTSDNSEDFLFSQNFSPTEFYVMNHFIGQDDRRFKTLGYVGMVKHLIINFYKFLINDLKHFDKKSKYWQT